LMGVYSSAISGLGNLYEKSKSPPCRKERDKDGATPRMITWKGWASLPISASSLILAKRRQFMGIFQEMHELRLFNSDWEYRELKRMLSESISRGYVEQIPVMKPQRWVPNEEWYRDKETGEIYSLVPPEEKDRGQWIKIDAEDLIEPDEKIQ
jgi:hypothetical protein